MKNQVFLLVILLLLVPSTSALLTSESAILDITFKTPVTFELEQDGFLSNLEIEFVMLPLDDYRQNIVSENYNVLPEKTDTNTVIFTIKEAEDIVINSNFVVETQAEFIKISDKTVFPFQEIDPSFYKFIKPSTRFDINQDIERLAASLAEGKDDLFEVVVEISNWINQNMDYDLSVLQEQNLTASWVLENKKGVCTEYTSLFVALTRSLGIPSREVSGIAFTDSDLFPRGWDFHSWAEVYFPNNGWIPFDPTYGQNGFLDAGHVKLGTNDDFGIRRNSFSWKGRGINVIPGDTELDVKIISKTSSEEEQFLSVTKYFLEDRVSISSYNVLFVELKNNNPFYVSETVRFANVEGLTFLSSQNRAIAIPPFDSIKVPLVFRVNDLSEDFGYVFPLKFFIGVDDFSLSFSASRNEAIVKKEDVSVFLEPQKKDYELIKCDYSHKIKLGEYLEINCASLGESGTLCFDEECEFFDKDEELILSKKTKNSGLFTKSIIFESNTFQALTFARFLVVDEAALDLSGTKHSQTLFPGDEGFINISMRKESSDNPKNISLKIKHPHFEEVFFIEEITDELVFSYSFPSNILRRKENTVIVNATFYDSLGEEYSSQIKLSINVEGLSLLDEVSFFFRRIYFWFANLW